MSDEKKIRNCRILFNCGMRKRANVIEKLDKYGTDWMTPQVYNDWYRASLIFGLLDNLIDNDDEDCFDYKLFMMLGFKLLDLIAPVHAALIKLDDKKEN